MGRVLELKHLLVDQQKADFHQFDELLADIKLSPLDIEIAVPPFFRIDNLDSLKERDKLLDALNATTFGIYIYIYIYIYIHIYIYIYIYIY